MHAILNAFIANITITRNIASITANVLLPFAIANSIENGITVLTIKYMYMTMQYTVSI